ncbi:hypothetical protein PGT21_028886 [Puccinia graminis f. sp. tritici]|uniref:Uncharacterized protein n=1 Tax=Puccinia graminis f. sp. tritici TaxID=56615 RepID=A0A5B0QYG7_PUCGR|nr:hypothetical protein PGT21_028886 [Puccinia graminis f. sp. tritici]
MDQVFIGFVPSAIIPGLSKVRKKIRKKQLADISYIPSPINQVQERILVARPDEYIGTNRCFTFILKTRKQGNQSTFKPVGESEIKSLVSVVRLTIDWYIAYEETSFTVLLYYHSAGSPIKRTYTVINVRVTSLALLRMGSMIQKAPIKRWKQRLTDHWKQSTVPRKSSTPEIVVKVRLYNDYGYGSGDID